MRDRLRTILRIARWEAGGVSHGLDRRTLLGALALVLIIGAVVGGGVAVGVAGFEVDRDIYHVGVEPNSPYADAIEADPALISVGLERAEVGETVDVAVYETGEGVAVTTAETTKGEAAAEAVRAAIEAHNERRMAAEENQTAAFPVTVELRYESRTVAGTDGPTLGEDPIDEPDGADADNTVDSGPTDDESTVDSNDATDDDSTADSNDATDGEDATAHTDPADGEDGFAVPSIGDGGGEAFGADAVGSPGSITPPFPFLSLLLAFVFLVPMNFLIQAYGSSILNERINRRGELLLVAPIHAVDVVAGKTLPYVGAAVAVTAIIAVGVGGGLLSVLAMVPIALTFLAATFVGAMFARSFKELTFVTVAVSVLLTTYAFIPAVFTNVTPVALISPLTIVVLDLQGEAVSIVEFLFSTGPVTIAAGLLFLLGVGVYREEDMFTQKPVPRKLLDALAVRLASVGRVDASAEADVESTHRWGIRRRVRGLATVAFITACTVPFVFVAELLAVAVLFALPVTVSIPVLLVTLAFIEEVAKSIHLYAGFERDIFARTDRVAVAVGLASGLGFFLAEKATAVVQAVGLTDLFIGRAAFGEVAGLDALPLPLAIGLFFAPLALHGFATVVAAVGASRNRAYYTMTLVIATLLHAAYNFGVVSLYG
ncbi:PrsW family intramembrane metalloprotease [Halorubrum vacuolatum]|uniref:ABC-type transport system permease protein n=1 Tax=Halorubrum vacuolatum TaxID=63740 RepID=A0A238VCQ3_HALVU|nr:PrsW family intramembrane metalloprotease [Halorubrum vacuolatum]SNR32001.1 ABC-type transport system permease protein [Halorubrum vacuolatum]